MLAVIVVGLTAFAMFAAKVVGVDPTFLWPLGEQGHEDFWRRVLPWPRGVQEDDEIAWHVPAPPQSQVARSARPLPLATPVPPTAPQRRIVGR